MKTIFLSLLTATSLLTAAPQAVVFDFGGVMTGETRREEIVQFLCQSFHLSKDDFEKINLEKRKSAQSGQTDEEFWLAYAKREQISLPDQWSDTFTKVLKDSIGVNPEMFQIVDQLKEKQIPVALFSNIDDRYAKLLRGFGLYQPFDPCILSCEIGANKPDPLAYKTLIEMLRLPSEEILFIDDKIENVEQAKAHGIDAIQFMSVQQIRQELEQRKLL